MHFALYLIKDDRLIPHYVKGDNYRFSPPCAFRVGQGLSGWVAENRKPILNGNPSVESGYLNNPSVFSTLRSAISVPLYASTNLIGVLSLYHESRDAFTKDQLRLLQSIAPKLALTIEIAGRIAGSDEGINQDLPGAEESVRHLDAELVRCRRLNMPLAIIICSLDGLSRVQANIGRLDTDLWFAVSACPCGRDFGIMIFWDELVLASSFSCFLAFTLCCSREGYEAYADRLRQRTECRVVMAAEAMFPEDGGDADQLLSAADRRIFQLRTERYSAAPRSACGARRLGAISLTDFCLLHELLHRKRVNCGLAFPIRVP